MAEYISRTDAECIMAMLVMEVSARPKDFTCGEAVKAIRSIPAADVSPVRHGRWEDINDLECFECSCCGECANQPWGLDGAIMFSYCPNCGAKMDARQPYEPATLTVIPAEEMTEQDKAVKAEALKTLDNEKGV